MEINFTSKGTIEVSDKVDKATEKALKDNGFSHSISRKCWYALKTPKRVAFLKGLEKPNPKKRALALLKLGKGKMMLLNK